MRYSMVNGRLAPANKASLLVGDLAIQRGYGVFDFFKTLEGMPVFLEEHLDRFFSSAEALRLPLEMGRDGVKEMISQLMEANGVADSGVRLTLTGGYSPDGYSLAKPNLVITQQVLTLPAAALVEKGMKLITHAHQRQMPEVKTIDYLMAIWLQPVIRERGADDVLYQWDGVVSECPRSNFFIVTKEGRIATAGRNVLRGITRKNLLEIGSVEERDVTLTDIREAREAFISSTTKYIVPVVEVDGIAVGDGKPGKITEWLLAALRNHHV